MLTVGTVTQYTGPHRRAYERSPYARFLVLWQKLSPVAIALVAFLLAAGFGFEKPANKFDRLTRADSAHQVRLDSIVRALQAVDTKGQSDRTEMLRRLDFLTVLRCEELDPRQQRLWEFCRTLPAAGGPPR
jgi:hypothetical protein